MHMKQYGKFLTASVFVFLLSFSLVAGETPGASLPFQPGETLTYDISWSSVLKAGTAVMQVKEETRADGRRFLHFVSRANSTGMTASLYPLNYTVQSVFDPDTMQTLSYRLRTSNGKREKSRDLVFNHAEKTVTSISNNSAPETFPVPDRVQDALSSIYYLRTLKDLGTGATTAIKVHDNGKNLSEEVTVLGTEKIKTGAGEFSTIKVRINSKHEGFMMSKGEVFIWLTNDGRRIPVLVMHKIKVGSIMMSLAAMKPGGDLREAQAGAS